MSNPLLVHIGYHKTGSSWLQQHVFRQEACGFYSPWKPQDYIEEFIIVNPFCFEGKRTRSFFEPELQHAWNSNLIPVITHEMLSGNPWKGGYNNPQTADRLLATFPEAKILVVIREQSSMILSLYKHRVRNGLTASIKKYLEPPRLRSGFEPLFRLEYLEYHWLISYYQQLFGRDQVLVLPYEMLSQDRPLFLNSIADFAGVKSFFERLSDVTVNKSYSGLVINFKRLSNMLFASRYSTPDISWQSQFNNLLFYQLDQFLPRSLSQLADVGLKQSIQARIEGHYQKSNQMTSHLIDLDLVAYGYQA